MSVVGNGVIRVTHLYRLRHKRKEASGLIKLYPGTISFALIAIYR